MVKPNKERRYRISDPQIIEKLNLPEREIPRYTLTKAQEKEYFSLVGTEETTTQTTTYQRNQHHFTAVGDDGNLMDIQKYCAYYGLDFSKVRSYKLVTHTAIPFYNIAFYETKLEAIEEELDFTSIFKSQVKPLKINVKRNKGFTGAFDRLVYTDTHIGMNPNADGFSQYGGKWDEQEVEQRLITVIEWVIQHQNSRTLYIDDLGDFMDGWNGFTTRGGHALPQNMDNQKAYDVGLSFKVRMVDELALYYDRIVCRNVCNNNHGGAFDYVVNSAFKSIVELKYPEVVRVDNQRKFMDHYVVETEGYNFTFITSHGKDEQEKKHGFNPKLNDKDQKQIDGYINENFLHQKDTIIQFDKGDTHLELYDFSSADRFYYLNYPALSPSSNYIQTNYQKGRSGFGFFNYSANEKVPRLNPKHFDWRTEEKSA